MKRNEIFERVEILKRDLRDYNKGITILNHFDRVNSFFNRFHRLVLDGSYDGYNYYKTINYKLTKNYSDKGYKSIIYTTFNQLLYHEYFNREYRLSPKQLDEILKEILQDNYNSFMNDLLDNLYDVREYENNITEERKIIDFTKVL